MLRTPAAALVTLAALSAPISGCLERDTGEEGDSDLGGGNGGDRDLCAGTTRDRALAWTEGSELGSAAEVFAGRAGTCKAPFTWDASALDDRDVQPRAAASELTVTVELDQSSARFVQPPEGAPPGLCPSFLEVDGNVRLQTADGVFNEMGATTLRYSRASGVQPFGFGVALGKQMGGLKVALEQNEQGGLDFLLDGAGASCAGNVGFNVSASDPGSNGGVSGGGASLGQWSNTGCPLGEQRFDLTTPRADQPSLAEQLSALWSNVSYTGTWDDGWATTLKVQLAVTATSACGSENALDIPVEVNWGTADGRIVEHKISANVHLGNNPTFGLWISDEMKCDAQDDTLNYTRASCAEVESVTLQLGLNSSRPGETELAGGGVNVYGKQRASTEPRPLQTLTLKTP